MTDLPIDVLQRLSAAVICGAVMGLHVGLTGLPGGLRTHILTTVGAALFCVTSQRLAGGGIEALRAVQGIASGVGFIGAAAVLREGRSVRGIATGASLWIAAAVGCSAGFGDSLLAGHGGCVRRGGERGHVLHRPQMGLEGAAGAASPRPRK